MSGFMIDYLAQQKQQQQQQQALLAAMQQGQMGQGSPGQLPALPGPPAAPAAGQGGPQMPSIMPWLQARLNGPTPDAQRQQQGQMPADPTQPAPSLGQGIGDTLMKRHPMLAMLSKLIMGG